MRQKYYNIAGGRFLCCRITPSFSKRQQRGRLKKGLPKRRKLGISSTEPFVLCKKTSCIRLSGFCRGFFIAYIFDRVINAGMKKYFLLLLAFVSLALMAGGGALPAAASDFAENTYQNCLAVAEKTYSDVASDAPAALDDNAAFQDLLARYHAAGQAACEAHKAYNIAFSMRGDGTADSRITKEREKKTLYKAVYEAENERGKTQDAVRDYIQNYIAKRRLDGSRDGQ